MPYQIKDLPVDNIIEWDIKNWSQLINYWAPILSNLPKDSSVLAIGERNGGLSLWLALLGFNVVCTDREGPTSLAKELHKEYNVLDKITYKNFDIVNDEWDGNQYDVIIAKSVIGGLKADPSKRETRTFEVQQKAVQNIYNLLKPGGYFFSAENLKGSALINTIRNLKNKNSGWLYLKMADLNKLFEPFKTVKIKTFGILPTLFGSSALNNILFAVNKGLQILPGNYKYIAFTTARK